MTGPADPSQNDGVPVQKPIAQPEPRPEAASSAGTMRMAQAGGLSHRRGPNFCRNCGTSTGPGARFCMVCGTSLFYDPDLAFEIRRKTEAPSSRVTWGSHPARSPGSSRRMKYIIIAAIILAVTIGLILGLSAPAPHPPH